MPPETRRATRLVRRLLVAAAFAAAVLLALVVQHHRAARDGDDAVAADDGAPAASRGWLRFWPGGGRSAPPLPTWRLEGRVVDSSNRPIAGAAVILAHPALTRPSAADGRFVFDGLLAGAYDVEARQGDRVGGPVRVHVGPDGQPVTLRMYRGARLELEVVSILDGHPIPNADVEVRVAHMHEGGGTQHGKTGADGKVQLPGAILIGSEAWASAPGYAPAVKALDPSWQQNGSWHARLELMPGAVVSGRVVDEHGFAVAGAIVEPARVANGSGGRASATDSRIGNVHPLSALVKREGIATDADGRFQVALSAGAWRLVASHDQHQTAVTDRILSDGRTPRDGLVVVMPAGVRVHGTVVRADGQPAPGALVRVRWQFNARVEREVRADGDGRFVIRGLPPGLLSFQAEAQKATSMPVHLDLATPPKDEVKLELANDGVITGTVVDEANNPLPDVDVVYVEHSPSMLLTRVQPGVETTDGAGRFTIRGLAPGVAYALNAKRPQDGDAAFRIANTDATPGQDVTLRIPGDGSVAGRVVRAGGGSLADVVVEVLDGGRPPQPVGGDGRFRIDDLFARPYTLRVSAANAAFKDVPVTVTPGAVADVGTVELPRGRRVAGVVKRADGTPAPGIGVDITVAGEPTPIGVLTDGDGRFSATAPADATLTLRARDRRFGDTAPLEVAASAPAGDLVLSFRPTGSVEGTLTAAGKPLGHRGVLAFPDAASGTQPATVQSAQSDESGYYRIDGLQPGTYTVQLATSGAPTDAPPQHVPVVVGQRAYASFDLPTVPPP